jgi:hypothetical protein
MDVGVGICTYDGKGWSQKLMAYPLRASLDEKAYKTLITGGHLRDSIFVPGPQPAAVRLLVKDVPSGRRGSVYIKVSDLEASAPVRTAGSGVQQVPQ